MILRIEDFIDLMNGGFVMKMLKKISRKNGIRRWGRLFFWTAFAILGIGSAAWLLQGKEQEAEALMVPLPVLEDIRHPVALQTVESQVQETWRSYYGRAKASNTQNVTSWVREIVQEVPVRVGDRVKAGQTVVVLRKGDHRAKAAADRTGYEEALLNYNRLSELQKKGGISQAEVDKAYAVLKTEEANAQASQSTLQRTSLKASIDGVVSMRSVEPGEVAEVGTPLITIVDLNDMEVELMVSKQDINIIHKDTPVEILVDGVASRGWVKRVSPEALSGSGLYPVVVGLNKDSGILPGTYLEGRFMVDKKDEVVLVPSSLIRRRGSDSFVYVAEDGKAVMKKVETDKSRDGQVVVAEGLKPGDSLIVEGFDKLSDGDLISIL